MKKTYNAPYVQTVTVRTMSMIAASDSINSDYLDGVSYGGVDEDGTIDPSSRRGSIWDDDEETE